MKNYQGWQHVSMLVSFRNSVFKPNLPSLRFRILLQVVASNFLSGLKVWHLLMETIAVYFDVYYGGALTFHFSMNLNCFLV